MKKITTLILIFLLVSSCSLRVEKRRYFKGYYVGFNRKNNKQNNNLFDKSSHNYTSKLSNAVSNKETLNYNHNRSSQLNENIKLSGITENKSEYTFTKKTSFISGKLSEAKVDEIASNSGNSIAKYSAKENEKKDALFLFMSGLFATTVSFLFKPLVSRTRKIGYWALNNRKSVRALHFAMHSFLVSAGFYLGGLMHHSGITSSATTTIAFTAISSALLLMYPSRRSNTGILKNTYKMQKWFALAFAVTGFLFAINLGNRYASEKYLQNTYSSVSITEEKYMAGGIEFLTSESPDDKKGLSDSERKALAALVIISCIFLCVVIAAAACALACSGQAALSILVLVAGFPVVILGAVKLVDKLLGPIRAKKKLNAPVKPK